MTRDEIRGVIEKSYQARKIEDIDAVMNYFSESATFRIAANEKLGDVGKTRRGHDELRPFFEQIFADWDWEDFSITNIVIDDSAAVAKAAVHCSGTMRHTPTDQKIELDTLDLLTFDKGKIISFVEFFDTDLFVQVINKGDG